MELLNELGEDVHGAVVLACAGALSRIAKTDTGRKACVKWYAEPNSEFGKRPPRTLLDVLDRLSRTPVKRRNDAVAPALAILNALLAMAKLDDARGIIMRVKRSPVHEVVPRLLPKISGSRDAMVAALKLVKHCLPPPPPPPKLGPVGPRNIPWRVRTQMKEEGALSLQYWGLYAPNVSWYSRQRDNFSERPMAEALVKFARNPRVKRSTRAAAALAEVVERICGEKVRDSVRPSFWTEGTGADMYRYRLAATTQGFAGEFAGLIHEPAVRSSSAAAAEFAVAVHDLAKSERCVQALIDAGAPAVLVELAMQP
jgi:hypothetical protein